MRDGDVVCTLGGVAYDSVENLRAFMNGNPSGRELVGGLVRIDGVQHETLGDEGSASQSLGDFSPSAPKFAPIYFVMTGIGRYVRHHAQAGAKQANAVLSCNLGAGAGDGLVQLVVKTRNRSGIAAGSPVLLNFGMDYDHSVVSRVFAEEASQPKRLRTMLDAYFKRLGERDAFGCNHAEQQPDVERVADDQLVCDANRDGHGLADALLDELAVPNAELDADPQHHAVGDTDDVRLARRVGVGDADADSDDERVCVNVAVRHADAQRDCDRHGVTVGHTLVHVEPLALAVAHAHVVRHAGRVAFRDGL